jgi:hypothetical protein
MTEELDKIDSYDGDDEDDDRQPFVFSKANKYTQIFVVGLLVGCFFFGIYLLGMGIYTMSEAPHPIANGTLHNMMCYTDSYFKSDKRNEFAISNCGDINAKSIWIGTPEEYQAWSDMKLMDQRDHFFTSDNGQFKAGKIAYKAILRYYGMYEEFSTFQDTKYAKKIVIITDMDKINATTYEINILGNQTNPIFTIKNIETKFVMLETEQYYRQIT